MAQPTYPITIDLDGKTYSASYSVSSGVVTVNSFHGSKATQVGGSSPVGIATILFSEILQEAKRRGDL